MLQRQIIMDINRVSLFVAAAASAFQPQVWAEQQPGPSTSRPTGHRVAGDLGSGNEKNSTSSLSLGRLGSGSGSDSSRASSPGIVGQ